MTTVTLDKTRPAGPVPCPPWCTSEHDASQPWYDPTDDFHRSDDVDAELPAGARTAPGDEGMPILPTHLVMHSVDPGQSCLMVGDVDTGFELETPEQVDDYLSNLTDYLFRVRAMRDRLAAIRRGERA